MPSYFSIFYECIPTPYQIVHCLMTAMGHIETKGVPENEMVVPPGRVLAEREVSITDFKLTVLALH